MTVAKGQPWGTPGALPDDGIVVTSDADARRAVEDARRRGAPLPVLGLAGGDLYRTLGGQGGVTRLRSGAAVTFPLDVVRVEVGESTYWFVAHLVARNRSWTRVTAAMNGAWWGSWNPAPKAHPNDGLVDVVEARLHVGDLGAVRRRLPHGAHLPHPRIAVRRVAEVEVGAGPRLWLDGERVRAAGALRLVVEPDALTVVV